MNMKRAKVTVPAALVSAALALSACSNNAPDQSKKGEAASSSSTGATSFSYMMAGKYVNWLKDLKWFPVLQSETGTQVNLVDGGADDDAYAKNLDLKIGSGQFPDSGIVSLAQSEVYGSQGVFIDLKPLIDQFGPNIKAFLDKNPEYKNLVTDKDGKIYGLPQEYPTITNVTFYREDLFKKAGITSNPKTVQEFTDDLKKLKDTFKSDPNFYPLTGRDSFVRYTEVFNATDNITNGKVNGIYEGGLGFDLYSPGFKQLVQWYIQLYNDKLIDPEWVAGTATEETWQTKMLTGKGAIGNDFFTRPSWFMNNGGPKNDPNYSIKVMDPFMTIDGKQSKVPPAAPQYRTDRVFVINSKAKDKAQAIVKFMDYVFSDKGRTLMDYGVEGQSFKTNGSNKEYTVEFEKEGNKPLGTPVWNFLQDRLSFPAPVNNAAYYQWMDPLTKSFATTYFDKFAASGYPSIKYTADQLKERTSLLATVKTELNGNLVKFITGKRDMGQWDAFLKEMDQLGYKKIVQLDQTAYDAMKK